MIEFESVGKTFRDGTAAVQDLSLTIPSDKITVVVGPSGCGKTTTLRMVNRMLEPTSGRIVWDGAPLRSRRKTAIRRQMGYVIQSGGLFPHRTVIDNIGTVPGLVGWSKDKTRKRSFELLDSVGLDRKMAGRYPAQLSGGQQQRVGVARALAADPLVMLMDEPFSAVDPVVRGELHEFFLGLQRQISKTILLITHDIEEAIKLGDQVVILRVGGRLAQAGTPQQLLDEPADAFVEGFVGRDRGYRSLSFLPAASLELDRVAVVRDAESARGSEPTLVLDADARPLGWVDTSRPGQVYPVGSTFEPENDTLRAALDSALTSPFGLAVAISAGSGRYAGVVGAAAILAQVSSARTQVVESISVRAAEAAAAAGPAREAGAAEPRGGDEKSPGTPTQTEPVADGPGTAGNGADESDHPTMIRGEPVSVQPGEPVLPQTVTPVAGAAQPAESAEPAGAATVEDRSEPAPVEPAPVEPAPVEPAPVEPAPVEAGEPGDATARTGATAAPAEGDASAEADEKAELR